MSENQAVLPELDNDARVMMRISPGTFAAERDIRRCRESQLRTLLQSLADAGIEVKDGKVFRPQRDNDFLHAAEYAGVPFDRAAAVAVALTHRGWRTPLVPPTDSTKEVR